MKLQVTLVLSVLMILMIISACNSTNHKVKPDISHIQVPIKIKRFEQALFSIDSTNYQAKIELLKGEYPEFFSLFVGDLMNFGNANDPQKRYQDVLLDFVTEPDIKSLYDSTLLKYPDLGGYESEIAEAFRYFKHYYPDHSVPQVISHISAFGPAAFTYDTTLIGVNLDNFLGKDFEFYAATNKPNYIRRRFEAEYIAPSAMKVFAQGLYEKDPNKSELIDEMVYQGKIIYFLERMMPDTPDSLITNYSGDHLDWLTEHEAQIWAFLIENELLYSKEYRKYSKFINDGPNTPGLPIESPGNVGAWVGWQIVRTFMEKYPDTALDALMEMKSGQEMLQKSRYKPER